MKNIKLLLVLIGFVVFCAAAYCQDSGRTYWSGSSPSDVAARANGMSFGSGGGDGCAIPMGGMNFDPAMGMMNSMLMMQNGGQSMTNPYQMQDMQRQQQDFAKQQMKEMQEADKQEEDEAKAEGRSVKHVKAVKHTDAQPAYYDDNNNFNTPW